MIVVCTRNHGKVGVVERCEYKNSSNDGCRVEVQGGGSANFRFDPSFPCTRTFLSSSSTALNPIRMQVSSMLRSTVNARGSISSRLSRCSVASSSRHVQRQQPNIPSTAASGTLSVRPYATASGPSKAEVKGAPAMSQTNSACVACPERLVVLIINRG